MQVAICDDHPIVADGIAALLTTLDPQIQVQHYTTARALLDAAACWPVMDLVLLDLGLPDGPGLQALARLRELRDDVPVVVVSALTDRTTVLSALDMGAMGFVPKSASTDTMLSALRVVLQGGYAVPQIDYPDLATAAAPSPQDLSLTPRQWEILHRILQGKSVKRIALDLDIAQSTVKTHITPILRELGVTTRTEAIVKAGLLGLQAPRSAPVAPGRRAPNSGN